MSSIKAKFNFDADQLETNIIQKGYLLIDILCKNNKLTLKFGNNLCNYS